MGNVCAADEACFDYKTDKLRRKSKSARTIVEKKTTGCLILKVKKVNINTSKLEEVLMSHQVNASSVQMILQFRDQTYNLDTLKQDFESLCLGDMSDGGRKSQVAQLDQDDQFKFNVDSVTPQDIVSIKLLVPPDMTATDFFQNMEKEGTIGGLPKATQPTLIA